MKLVAKNDFFNSPSLGITVDKKDKLFRHENHVHKGARFEIGSAEHFKDLKPDEKENVGRLLAHGCAVMNSEENDKNGVIETIDAEAKAEFAAHKAALAPRPSLAEAVASAVAEALAGVAKSSAS